MMMRVLLGVWLVLLLGCAAQLVPAEQATATPVATKVPVVFSAEMRILDHPPNQSGQLYFVEERPHPNYRIAELDMASGSISTLFSAPLRSLISDITADHKRQQLIIAYTAPAEEGAVLYDRSGLYSLGLSGAAQPELLLGGDEAGVYYYQPTIAADGDAFIFLKYSPNTEPELTVGRYDFATKAASVIATHVVEPHLSRDGEQLVMTAIDPLTKAQSLVIGDGAGQNLQTLVGAGQFYDVEQPRFSADNQWVYFVVLEEPEQSARRDWIALLTGAQVAEAHGSHSIPGDWWRVPVEGGEAEQVTYLGEIVNSAETAPDNSDLAFATRTGLYLHSSDGTLNLIKSRAIFNITWIP